MIGRFLSNRHGSAAAEFALSLPMMVVLMFGGLEAGHFFWTEHKLVKAVRDGARYAARLDITSLCTTAGNPVADPTVYGDIRAVTATGLPAAAGATPKVSTWKVADVGVDVRCGQFVKTGIYSQEAIGGSIVIISSGPVTYPSLFQALVGLTSNYKMSAESSAPVTGI